MRSYTLVPPSATMACSGTALLCFFFCNAENIQISWSLRSKTHPQKRVVSSLGHSMQNKRKRDITMFRTALEARMFVGPHVSERCVLLRMQTLYDRPILHTKIPTKCLMWSEFQKYFRIRTGHKASSVKVVENLWKSNLLWKKNSWWS
jgi:hypothetical protein